MFLHVRCCQILCPASPAEVSADLSSVGAAEMREPLDQWFSVFGHKRSNVPQREGLSVPQRHAAVGLGHPSMPFAAYTVSPSIAKTLQAVKLFP